MVFEIGSLANANPVVGTRSHERVDPYWDGLWDSGSVASWANRDVVEAQAGVGLVSGGVWSRPGDVGVSLRELARGRARLVGLPGLAAVNLWRTVTGEQLGALTGHRGFGGRGSSALHRLWSSGLVDVGRVPLLSGGDGLPWLVRPSARGDWGCLRGLLTFDEWVGVTGGVPWRWGSQHARHNVLVAELGLRVAEVLRVPVVLGEHLCGVGRMGVPGVRVSEQQSNFAGDALLVRDDGLRIVVELTASTTGFERKAQRWADVLLSDRSGLLCVVFVHAPHPVVPLGRRREKLSRAVGLAAHSSVSHIVAGVPSRMMVASWRDWFPGRHVVSEGFLGLRADRPVGLSGDDRWRSVECLDPFDLVGPRDADLGLLSNVDWLWGVPHWLRGGGGESPTDVWARLSGVVRFPRQEGLPDPPQVRAARAG